MSRRLSAQYKSNQQRSHKSSRSETKVKFPDEVIFLESIKDNDLDNVKNMLRRASVDIDINKINEKNGLTPLHQAVFDESMDIIKLLVENKANINVHDADSWTPLHACCSMGNEVIAKYLIEHGADLLALTNEGERPLDLVEQDNLTLIALMLNQMTLMDKESSSSSSVGGGSGVKTNEANDEEEEEDSNPFIDDDDVDDSSSSTATKSSTSKKDHDFFHKYHSNVRRPTGINSRAMTSKQVNDDDDEHDDNHTNEHSNSDMVEVNDAESFKSNVERIVGLKLDNNTIIYKIESLDKTHRLLTTKELVECIMQAILKMCIYQIGENDFDLNAKKLKNKMAIIDSFLGSRKSQDNELACLDVAFDIHKSAQAPAELLKKIFTIMYETRLIRRETFKAWQNEDNKDRTKVLSALSSCDFFK